MYDKVLRLKHWQFFVIGFALPALGGIAWIAYAFSKMFRYVEEAQRAPNGLSPDFLGGMYEGMIYVYLPSLLTLVLSWAWLGAIVERLGPLADPVDRPRPSLFKPLHLTFIIGSVLAVGSYYWIFTTFVANVEMAGRMSDPSGFESMFFGMLVMYGVMFAVLGVQIYITIAAARVYVSAQRPYYRDNGAVAVAVIAMLYWPIGIWFLQPKINVLATAADDYARTGIPPLPREHYY